MLAVQVVSIPSLDLCTAAGICLRPQEALEANTMLPAVQCSSGLSA